MVHWLHALTISTSVRGPLVHRARDMGPVLAVLRMQDLQGSQEPVRRTSCKCFIGPNGE